MALYQRGRVWWADYYVSGKRVQESTGKTNRRAAEKFLARRVSEVERGVYAERSNITFEELCDPYLDHAKLHKRSWLRDGQLVRPIKMFFPGCKLSEITVFGIERFGMSPQDQVHRRTVFNAGRTGPSVPAAR